MLSAVVGGCALVPTLDGELIALAPPAVAVSPLAPPPRTEPEARVPRQIAREVGDVYVSAPLERRLAAIVARLSPFSDRPDLRYSVTILDSPAVNAFALGDGQLFVTRGLLALANDTAEIAAVIAHEMGHVSARHAAARTEQAETALLVQRVVADVTRDRRAAERALATSALSLASFSRAQELEADRIGIRTLMRAGFDPFGAVRFLEGMDRYLGTVGAGAPGGASDPEGILATHPTTPERLAAALGEARLQIETGERGEADREGWLGAVDGLVYGDDPRRGAVRGRAYLHPTLRFAFEAPPGFRLENTLRAVLGTGPDGQALRFDTVRVPAGTALERALADSATPEFMLDAIETREVDGLPAAIAVGRSPAGCSASRWCAVARRSTASSSRWAP